MRQQLQWIITGLLLGTGSLAAAKGGEQAPSVKQDDTLEISISMETRGAYDFKSSYAGSDFGPAAIPTQGDPSNRKRVLFDMPSAAINIEKKLVITEKETLKLVMQVGLMKELALKDAYADFKGLRIGKTSTNFCDLDACDLVGGSFLQVRWQQKLGTFFSYAVAIEEAPDLVIYTNTKGGSEVGEEQHPQKSVPAISAHVRHEQEGLWHVQVSGLLRFLEYRNKKLDTDCYMPAWGLNVGTAVHLVPGRTTLKLQGVYGRGIGDYIADIGSLGEGYNTVCGDNKGTESVLKTVDAWSVGLKLAHQWSPKLCSEVAYRFSDVRHSDKTDYKHGHAGSANLFYSPIKGIRIGTECLFSARENVGGNLKDAYRIQAVVGIEL